MYGHQGAFCRGLGLHVLVTEELLHACECELKWLDMSINLNKSRCLRTDPQSNTVLLSRVWPAINCHGCLRCDISVCIFCSLDHIKCSLDAAKRGFYRAAISYW